MESINVFKGEISSRLDLNSGYQHQLLIRLYQQKEFKQALKDNLNEFDGRDNGQYAPWIKKPTKRNQRPCLDPFSRILNTGESNGARALTNSKKCALYQL